MSGFFKMGFGELCARLDVRKNDGVLTNKILHSFRGWRLAYYLCENK